MSRTEDRKKDRLARAKAARPSRPWWLLLVANALPVAFAVGIAVLYARGTISFVPGSENVVPVLMGLGVLLAVLVGLCWIILPVFASAVLATREIVDRHMSAFSREGAMSALLRLPFLAAGLIAYAVLWLNLVLLSLLVVANIVAIVVGLGVLVLEVLRVRG
jgi:hypothetical protein